MRVLFCELREAFPEISASLSTDDEAEREREKTGEDGAEKVPTDLVTHAYGEAEEGGF